MFNKVTFLSILLLVSNFVFSQSKTNPKNKPATTSNSKPVVKPTNKPGSKPVAKPTPPPPSPINYIVKGKLVGLPNYLVVLNKFEGNNLILMDSMTTDTGGNFMFKNKTKETCLAYLQYSQRAAVCLILENNCQLNVVLTPKDQGINYEVSGKKSESSLSIYKMLKNYSNIKSDLTILENASQTETDINKFQQLQYQYMFKQQELKTLLDTSLKNHNPLEGFFIFYNLYEDDEQRNINVKTLKEKFEKHPVLSKTSYTQNIKSYYETHKSIEIGDLAPEISLMNPDGQIVNLSSLKGKYVLIDFWASWCGPCIAEVPNVKRAYDKYKDRGFEIYAVSLDDNANAWKGAIIKYGLPWLHVSDLKKWQSQAAQLYKVRGIPFTVLIDPKGVIIGKNLRGEQLDIKLEEIFK